MSVPKDLQELVFPNPINETNKMYNNILFELYNSSYDLMSRAVRTAAALFGLSVFLFTENPLKCFIL